MCGMHAKDGLAVGRVAARGFVCLVVKHDRQNNKFMNMMIGYRLSHGHAGTRMHRNKKHLKLSVSRHSCVLLLAFS